MKNVTTMLFLLGVISPSVWGNDKIVIDSINFLELYKKSKYLVGINVSSDERIWSGCHNSSINKRDSNFGLNNVSDTFCNEVSIHEKKNIFVGLKIFRKDHKNRFTLSLQGGYNIGFKNEQRDDGSFRLRFDANLTSKYKFWIFSGKYKLSGKLVTPGSFPNQVYFGERREHNNHIKVDGLFFNKDPYLTFHMTF